MVVVVAERLGFGSKFEGAGRVFEKCCWCVMKFGQKMALDSLSLSLSGVDRTFCVCAWKGARRTLDERPIVEAAGGGGGGRIVG